MSSVLDWFSRNAGVTASKALSIERSAIDDPASGHGLFVDLTLIERKAQESTIELLRVPFLARFDLKSLMALLGDDDQYSSIQKRENLQARVKKVFLEFTQLEELTEILNETTILVFYFTLFALLRDTFELPKVVDFYLEKVLLSTTVESGVMCYDPTTDLYGQRPHFLALSNSLRILTSFFEETVGTPIPVGPMLKQVYAAIASRCLEIPEEVQEDSDDFVVNDTLVPVLDYANHSNDMNNAHFDLDRETRDVLLLLDTDQCPQGKTKFEVLISYSPIEDPGSFMFFYGFVPSTSKNS